MKRKTAVFCVAVLGLALFAAQCSKKPSQEELTRLEESRAAAEAAEKKLNDLRKERMELESNLEGKKGELQTLETERDDLRSQSGQ